jgi:hypothetical protein
MIIASYPGAGGNRYQRMMQNLQWQQPNITYNAVNTRQHFNNRYLLGEYDSEIFDLVWNKVNLS